jgi:hypothetical protein
MAAEVPVDALPANLQTLVAEPPAAVRRARGGARGGDQFEYALSVPAGRRRRTYRFRDGEIPPDLAPLVTHLSPMLQPWPVR